MTSSTFLARSIPCRGVVWRPEDYALSEQMMSYWTNFARTGDPNGGAMATVSNYLSGPNIPTATPCCISTIQRLSRPDENRAPRYEFWMKLGEVEPRHLTRRVLRWPGLCRRYHASRSAILASRSTSMASVASRSRRCQYPCAGRLGPIHPLKSNSFATNTVPAQHRTNSVSGLSPYPLTSFGSCSRYRTVPGSSPSPSKTIPHFSINPDRARQRRKRMGNDTAQLRITAKIVNQRSGTFSRKALTLMLRQNRIPEFRTPTVGWLV